MKKALIEISKKNLFIKFFFAFILIFFYTNLNASENKILIKIDNQIITSLDVENEKRLLIVLNPRIKDLEESQIFKIAKNSIIRQKIKKIEILKYTDELKIDDTFLNKLIKSNYSRIGINNLEDFEIYMKNKNINIQNIKEKMIIETLWNELIMEKFSSKIKINKQELKEEILLNKNEALSYNLYEILFTVSNVSKLDEKFKKIKKTINQSSFENAALLYSVSNTSEIGGELGWIEENSLNKKIRNELLNIKENQITKPIPTSGGFLILMIKDKKKIEKKINLDEELKKLINIRTNEQFNQFSNMFFKKVSKDISINEL